MQQPELKWLANEGPTSWETRLMAEVRSSRVLSQWGFAFGFAGLLVALISTAVLFFVLAPSGGAANELPIQPW